MIGLFVERKPENFTLGYFFIPQNPANAFTALVQHPFPANAAAIHIDANRQARCLTHFYQLDRLVLPKDE